MCTGFHAKTNPTPPPPFKLDRFELPVATADNIFPPLPSDTELLLAFLTDGDLPSKSKLDATLSKHGLSVTQDSRVHLY